MNSRINPVSIMQEIYYRPPKMFVALMTLLYFFANFFLVFRFKIIQDTNREDDNITTKSDIPDEDSARQIKGVYTTMLYFAVTTINTVGYGDVIPVNYYEYAIVQVFLLSGVFLYGFIMSEIQLLARFDLDIVSMRRDMRESFDSWLVSLEKKKLELCEHDSEQTATNSKSSNSQNNLQKIIASRVVHQAQTAYNLNLRFDRTSIFNNGFFDQMSHRMKEQMVGLYVSRFKSEFPGIFKLFEDMLDEHFVLNMQIRV